MSVIYIKLEDNYSKFAMVENDIDELLEEELENSQVIYHSKLEEIIDNIDIFTDEEIVELTSKTYYRHILLFNVQDSKLDQLENLLKSANIFIYSSDVTENIKNNDIPVSEVRELVLEHSDLINSFILSEITIDSVLEKITKSGMDSLTINELTVLKSK